MGTVRKVFVFAVYAAKLAFAFCALFALQANAQFVRSPRQSPIGNADSNGFARIDKIFYELDLGKGRRADMFFKFCTAPYLEPKYMGQYWSIAFIETKAVKLSNSRYLWKSPNHGTYTFNKLPTPERGYKESYILNTNASWKLNIAKNEQIDISNVRDPKNKFIFKNGCLAEFCVGEGGDVFRVSYKNNGFPSAIYNQTKWAIAVEFAYNSEGLLSEIRFIKDKKSIQIFYKEFKTIGQNGVIGLSKLVSSIKFTDGECLEYTYKACDEKKNRQCLAKDERESVGLKVIANRVEQVNKNSGLTGYIEWDATTGMIISDSGGEYAVRNPLYDKDSPEYNNSEFKADRRRNNSTMEVTIAYKKPENRYAEIWDYSVRQAIKITQNPSTGEKTRTMYIGAPGKASMKVRKIEKMSANDKEWKTQLTRLFNANGDIIRESDSEGNVREFFYNEKFEKVKTVLNGETIYEMKHLPDGKTEILKKDEYNGEMMQKIIFTDGKSLVRTRVATDTKMFCVIYDENENRVIKYYEEN